MKLDDVEFHAGVTQIRDDMEKEELAAMEAEYSSMWVMPPRQPMTKKEWDALFLCDVELL